MENALNNKEEANTKKRTDKWLLGKHLEKLF